MAITLNNITALRLGMRLADSSPYSNHSGWLYRSNLMYRDTDGSLKRLSFASDVATYTADTDVSRAGNPFQNVLGQWWGPGNGSLTKTPVYTTATLNAGLKVDGAVAFEIMVEGATPFQPTVLTADIRRNGGDWERIFSRTVTATITPTVYTLDAFEPSASFKFRHKGEALAGTFQGYAKGSTGITALTEHTNLDNAIEFPAKLTDELIYGTFIPNRVDLAPKIIGPIKVS